MKTISKKMLDKLIAKERKFWKVGGENNFDSRYELARTMEAKTGLSAFAIIDLLGGIVSLRGFAPDAENNTIYSVLRILGWEVTDEEHPAN